ncbi:MAG: 50S ribosomal protein L11 methyltransferase [Bryobacterales bacterium]|nr:50S ribosomal protein L11 methyltransferase [Bryobacterales bacterium]
METISADLWERGTQGITEHPQPGGEVEFDAFFDARFDYPGGGEWQEVEDTAWVDTFDPFAVGERLYVAPAWRDDPTPPGRLRLAVYARQASGSGYQPATQLALEALERYLRPGDRVLDVGAGSGILCAAAELLGAGSRFACDIDPVALAEARENATPAALFAGSARAVAAGSIDLVAANLNAEALLSLRDDLVRVLRPGGGRLILSGFQQRNFDRLVRAFNTLDVCESLASGRWQAIVLKNVHE